MGYVTICNTACVYYASACPREASAERLEWCEEFELLILYLWSLLYLKHRKMSLHLKETSNGVTQGPATAPLLFLKSLKAFYTEQIERFVY